MDDLEVEGDADVVRVPEGLGFRSLGFSLSGLGLGAR